MERGVTAIKNISCSTMIDPRMELNTKKQAKAVLRVNCYGSSHLFFLLYNIPIFIHKRGVLTIHRGKQGQQIMDDLITESSHCYHVLIIVGGQDMAQRADERRQQGDLWYSP